MTLKGLLTAIVCSSACIAMTGAAPERREAAPDKGAGGKGREVATSAFDLGRGAAVVVAGLLITSEVQSSLGTPLHLRGQDDFSRGLPLGTWPAVVAAIPLEAFLVPARAPFVSDLIALPVFQPAGDPDPRHRGRGPP